MTELRIVSCSVRLGPGVGGLDVGVDSGEVGVGLNEGFGVWVGVVVSVGDGVGCRVGVVACM